jgi:hypothetical protein
VHAVGNELVHNPRNNDIYFSYCKMHLQCIHMHSNECSKYMCVMEQNNKINYNLYTHINVQKRVTIFNIYREYMYIWNMYW